MSPCLPSLCWPPPPLWHIKPFPALQTPLFSLESCRLVLLRLAPSCVSDLSVNVTSPGVCFDHQIKTRHLGGPLWYHRPCSSPNGPSQGLALVSAFICLVSIFHPSPVGNINSISAGTYLSLSLLSLRIEKPRACSWHQVNPSQMNEEIISSLCPTP